MDTKVNDKIIEVLSKIAKRGEGALIVLGECNYKPLVKQDVPNFNIIDNPKLLESLCLMDGACIINKEGMLMAYGVMIESNRLNILKNFGTRHNSAINASVKEGNTVYVLSEEDNKIRVFQKGKLILEFDGRVKDIEKKASEISKIIESIGYGTLSTFIGLSLAPVVGIVTLSGTTIFVVSTSLTYVAKKFREFGWIK